MQKISEQVANAIYPEKADVSIITADGLVIAASKQPGAIGGSVDNLYRNEAAKIRDLMRRGEKAVYTDEATGLLHVLAPITLGDSDSR